MRLILFQRKQTAQHIHECCRMNVSNPIVKRQAGKNAAEICHRNTKSYSTKAAKNDTYSHGVMKSIFVTFKGK